MQNLNTAFFAFHKYHILCFAVVVRHTLNITMFTPQYFSKVCLTIFSVINNLCYRHNTIKALFKMTLNCNIVKCLNNKLHHRYSTKFLKTTV